MQTFRLISRLDIKGTNLIKGVQLEGLRVIGDPAEYAKKYYDQGIDELIYIDVVASLYGRNNLLDVVKSTASQIFSPLTVGGGIRTLDDVESFLRVGADKVCLNTAAIKNKSFISEIANRFGSQCCVVEIQAKRTTDGKWIAFFDNGRENSGLDAIKWADEVAKHGAGEILLTSVDQEGTRKGMDLDLIKLIASTIDVPVISSGGVGTPADIISAYKEGGVDAVAVGDILHNDRYSIQEVKRVLSLAEISIRL